MEKGNRDFLVSFLLDKEFQCPYILYEPKDFIGYASMNLKGDQMTWIEWKESFMPWQSNQLIWTRINEKGDFVNINFLLGSKKSKNVSNQISFFQPSWSPKGELVVAEDSSGWWNLIISTSTSCSIDPPFNWKNPWRMNAEFAIPQWVFGMSTFSFAQDKLISLRCKDGTWGLFLLQDNGNFKEIMQPFIDFAGLHASDEKVVAIASNSYKEPGLLELDLSDGSWVHTPSREPVIDKSQISVAEPFWFKGYQGEMVHSWYYAPKHSPFSSIPLLVKSHSGPTGMAQCGLDLEIQFWSSRGWAVLDVNYGGSTGFGRAYRERLNKKWGEVDVVDCTKGAIALVERGKADRNLIAIQGSSASGFTALSCLCLTDIFRVGACRYAVSDLLSMVKSTHRFEKNYLDSLLGIFSENEKIYLNRSPCNAVEKIQVPVIFFQGMKDKVVSPSQTFNIASKLSKRNIPIEVYKYEEEGHGFKDKKVKMDVLKLTERFFRKHLFP